MIRKLAVTVSIVLFAAMPLKAAVNSSAGIIFPELTNGAGARPMAMAGAFTAVADDAAAVYWNPAGLASVKNAAVSFSYDTMIMDSYMSNVLLAVPAGPGVAGLNLFYTGFGSFSNVDDSGNTLAGSVSPYTLSADIAYGVKFEMFSAGAGFRFMTQSRGMESSVGFAGDIGLGAELGIFKAALTGRNIGVAGDFSLPMDVRFGLAVKSDWDDENGMIISIDSGYVFNDAADARAGVELKLMKSLYLRGGYKYRFSGTGLTELAGVTAGAGLKLGMLGLDYAFVPQGELGTSHRMALTLDFGPAEKPAVKSVPGAVIAPVAEKSEPDKMFYNAGITENAKKLDEAADMYREIIKQYPDYAPAYKRLGAVFVKLKNIPKAIWCFEKYLTLVPSDAAVRKWLEKNK